MSDLIVLKFETTETATELREALKGLERAGLLNLEDAAVIYREVDGTVRQQNQVSQSTKIGAFGGAMAGLILGFMFPLVGLAAGAAGGAWVASTLDRGVDPKFVTDVGNALQPGHSALFLVVRSANRDAVLTEVRQVRGTVYHSSLGADAESALRQALASQPQ